MSKTDAENKGVPNGAPEGVLDLWSEPWTPGPWAPDLTWNEVKAGEHSIAELIGGRYKPGTRDDIEEAKANTRLLAASWTLARYVRTRAQAGDAEALRLWKEITGR